MTVRDRVRGIPDRWFCVFKVVVVVTSAVIPGLWVFGASVGLAIDGFETWWDSIRDGAALAGVLGGPGALYGAVIHRRLPVAAVGAGLLAIAAWSVWGALTGESSTSALAILWLPLIGLPLVVLGWIVQAWSRPPDY